MSVALVLALAATVTYGVSDYLAGVFSRRLRILDVMTVGYAVGLLTFIPAGPLLIGTTYVRADLAWGALAGVAGAAGVLLLVHGFRIGQFAVVSPVSAVGTAVIPVLVGVLLGEQLGPVTLLGLAAGIVAIALVSGARMAPRKWTQRQGETAAGLWWGLGAGVAYAGMFLALSRSDYGSGPWPVLALQLATVVIILIALAIRRQVPRVGARDLPGVAAIGATAVLGNLAFVYSARLGLVSVAAVIASMSPAVTVLLARLVTGERFTRRQLVGLVHAAVALVLIGVS